jgi:transcriptional regulator with XRE-family HTH domain
MSQRDLAEDAGVRQALISQIERGEANPTIDSILRIAVALNVSFSDLFDSR